MDIAEKKVRRLLSQEFKTQFKEIKLRIGKTIDGKLAVKKFDAVSRDRKVVAMVKTYSAENISGNQTRHARVIRDLYYLSLIQADKKFMFLSHDYYKWFKRQRDVAIVSGIDVREIT